MPFWVIIGKNKQLEELAIPKRKSHSDPLICIRLYFPLVSSWLVPRSPNHRFFFDSIQNGSGLIPFRVYILKELLTHATWILQYSHEETTSLLPEMLLYCFNPAWVHILR
jgi:hypothetical protein